MRKLMATAIDSHAAEKNVPNGFHNRVHYKLELKRQKTMEDD